MAQALTNPIAANVARLYHYEKFCPTWLRTTLCDQKIFCSNPATFNDPWDGKPQIDYRPMEGNPAEMEAYLEACRNMVPADLLKDPVRPLWKQRVRTDPHALRNSITLLSQKLATLSQKLAAEIAKRRIYCLVPCPRNTLMWSHYAAKHSGICLEFYVSSLLFLKHGK